MDHHIPDKTDSDLTYEQSYDQMRSTGNAEHGNIVAADKVTLARFATETRPKNIKVVFLMKCWH